MEGFECDDGVVTVQTSAGPLGARYLVGCDGGRSRVRKLDHGYESRQPLVWLDGLDTPLVAMLNAGFAETGESDEQAVTAPEGTSDAKYASGLLPVDWKPARQTSPIFNYPYARRARRWPVSKPRPARPIPATATSCAM